MTEIKTIAYDTAKDFLLPRHYSGRIPSISYAYGCYNDDNLVGVLTVGKLKQILLSLVEMKLLRVIVIGL